MIRAANRMMLIVSGMTPAMVQKADVSLPCQKIRRAAEGSGAWVVEGEAAGGNGAAEAGAEGSPGASEGSVTVFSSPQWL